MFNKMKPFAITIFIIFQLLTFFSCKVGEKVEEQSKELQLTQQEQDLIRELNQWLNPIGIYSLELSDKKLGFLDQLKSAKMVALGEATHGTREFFQMKHRIFQYLVENHQHKVFGFEADYAECIYLNNYVTKGEGDLRQLMKDKMHFWTWRTEEVYQLLDWMRDYNRSKNDGEKIHYYGFDCQFLNFQPDLLREYLQDALPWLWDTVSPVLDQVKGLSDSDYELMSKDTYKSIKTQLESLEDQFIANKDQLILYSSAREYEINKHLLTTFLQAFIVRYHYRKEDNKTNWRDLYMAENALWTADLFGLDTKITLWAHNGHIARNPSYGYSGSMGYHLYMKLNDLYQVVGFAFSQGSFQAVGQDQNGNYTGLTNHEITTDPLRTSINFLFHYAQYREFAFHLDGIPVGSFWDDWLGHPRPFLRIGAVFNGNPEDYYSTENIPGNYNWIIYFDSTSAAVRLN